jgi:hypothetical protein
MDAVIDKDSFIPPAMAKPMFVLSIKEKI